jgi:hypothetical protein
MADRTIGFNAADFLAGSLDSGLIREDSGIAVSFSSLLGKRFREETMRVASMPGSHNVGLHFGASGRQEFYRNLRSQVHA